MKLIKESKRYMWYIKERIMSYLDARSSHASCVKGKKRMYKYIQLAKKAKLQFPAQRYTRFMRLHGGPGDNNYSRKAYKRYLGECKQKAPFKFDSNLAGLDHLA